MLSVFCPHICEELWFDLGNKTFISLEKWPKSDERKIDKKLEKQEQAVEKLAEDINNIIKIIESKGKQVRRAFVYAVPGEVKLYEENLKILNKKVPLQIEIFSVADKQKKDPSNKSRNAKPGKPAIYLE